MIDKREKKLFKQLIDNYGFVVEEYRDNYSPHWVAVKYTDKGNIAVIVAEEEVDYISLNSLKSYLAEKGHPYAVDAVIYTREEQITHDRYDSEDSEHNYRKIIVSYSNDILWADENTDFLKVIIERSDKLNASPVDFSSKVTIGLIIINVAVFLYSAYLSGSLMDINVYVLYALGAKENIAIASGEYYRLITAAFLHGGLIHLLFNMYALNALGGLIDRTFGTLRYIIIYLFSAITSSLLSFYMSDSLSIGASGAIFGLMGAALIFGLREKNRIGRDFLTNILSVVGINIFIGLTQSNIDNFGHIGGLIGGLIISLIMYPKDYTK